MPKKSATARGGAQRSKPKAQKSFELVRPVSEVQEQEQEQEPDTQDVAEMAATSVSKGSKTAPAVPPPAAKPAIPEVPVESKAEPIANTSVPSKGSGSASSRLAARRQAAQQRVQRSATPLVTAEHYAYVRKDLIFIAILAIIMFAAIIILHFVLA